MLYTPNYNLSKAEGTDTVNLLTQNYPNFDIIDAAMKANADAGITVATETKTGTNHAIVRANTGAAVFRFTATSNYAAGDTFTVDTNIVTAVLPSGQSIPAGAFVINSSVLAILVGTQLTVLASAASTDAETLEGHAASYFATANDLQEVADDAADALELATKDIIWTNPAPDTALSGSTVTVDTKNHQHFIVYYKKQKLSSSIVSGAIVPIDLATLVNSIDSQKNILERSITINANSITFSTGSISGSVNNDYIIPVKIYGI